jgi:hypothetical protein
MNGLVMGNGEMIEYKISLCDNSQATIEGSEEFVRSIRRTPSPNVKLTVHEGEATSLCGFADDGFYPREV